MPKKNPPNAFWLFAQDYVRPLLQKQGRSINDNSHLIDLANPMWKSLTDNEKAVWKEKAKHKKNFMNLPKYDSSGKNIELRQKEEEIAKAKEKKMIEDIKKRVFNSLQNSSLLVEKFHFIHFNVFCKTENNHYIPAEVAVLEYNLQQGIIRASQFFIKPDNIPVAYQFLARDYAFNSHKIPVKDFSKASDNYDGIYMWLVNFVCQAGLKRDCQVFYTMPDEIAKCNYLLKWLYERSEQREPFCLEVHSIETLLNELQSASKPCALNFASDVLSRTLFDYILNSACKWHEKLYEKDDSLQLKFCSLHNVRRWAFHMSRILCNTYNIAMLPHHHFPVLDQKPPFDLVEEVFMELDISNTMESNPSVSNYQSSGNYRTRAEYKLLREPMGRGKGLTFMKNI